MTLQAFTRTAGAALIAAAALCAPLPCRADTPVAADTLTASEAFVRMPAKTLDLLTTSMRRDMLDYYTRQDSIADVMNALEGFSRLVRPVTPDYLQAEITPVSTLTVRLLPAKKGKIVMTIYTLGDSLRAADSEIRFYDAQMRELRRDKWIRIASSEDFLDLTGLDSHTRRELTELIPFPTVSYCVGPDSPDLTATLTVGEFLGKETMERLKPYLRPEITYTWTDKGYKLKK